MAAKNPEYTNQDVVTVEIPDAFREMFDPYRYKVFYGGRGGAKSWNFARILIMMGAQKKLRILCAREIQASMRDSVHKLLVDQIRAMGYGDQYRVTQKGIYGKNGTEFIFEGLKHNTNKIKSTEGVDIVWIEEADVVTNASWSVLIPTIRKSGSEIWVSFNTRLKTDATFQRFIKNTPPNTLLRKVGWQDNPWFPDELRAEKDYLKETDYDEYLHVWEGELKMYADGAIYAKQLQTLRKRNQIMTIPIEQCCEVHTFWDLGRNDETAIWFMQRIGLQNRFIDYYEHRLVDIDHYARVLREKDYTYGDHYMPHDIDVQVLGMTDTRRRLFEKAGIKPIRVVKRIDNINEGIELTRNALISSWIDPDRCEKGLEALSNYKYEYDEQNSTYRQTPAHTWASNGADAFRQFAQGYRFGRYSDRQPDDNPLARSTRRRARADESDHRV